MWGGDGETYDPLAQLCRAVVSFPLAVQRLMAKLNEQGVGKGLEWQVCVAACLDTCLPDPVIVRRQSSFERQLKSTISHLYENHAFSLTYQ